TSPSSETVYGGGSIARITRRKRLSSESPETSQCPQTTPATDATNSRSIATVNGGRSISRTISHRLSTSDSLPTNLFRLITTAMGESIKLSIETASGTSTVRLRATRSSHSDSRLIVLLSATTTVTVARISPSIATEHGIC